jgi:pilus assembly protein CpaB
MNRTRMLVIALFAVALSVLVAYLAYRTLSRRLSPPDELTQIVVAVEKLPLGGRVTAQQVRLASWPKANLPQGCFEDPGTIVGRGVVVSIAPNEPILESKLAPREAGAGLTVTIPEGMRALSVKVNEVIGVAGFVTPGTHVDVIAIGSPSGQGGGDVAKVFLENVQVLAAGQNVERDANGQPLQNVQVVTLLVSPEDAQKLALASSESHIQLALRNPMDQQDTNPAAFRKAALYGPSSGYSEPTAEPNKPRIVKYRPSSAPVAAVLPAVVAAPPPPRMITVEVIKGDKRESSSFSEKRP